MLFSIAYVQRFYRLVVDAHQKWCGPCLAIVSMLKRIKNELGDDILKFATVSEAAFITLPLLQHLLYA